MLTSISLSTLKLGWGVSSSIWLAFDQKQSRYVAVKALKSFENIRACKGDSFEFEALQAVTVTKTPSTHCLKLFAACNVPGKGRDGNHLCYVTLLQGGNVASLMGNDTFPFPLAKRIILHTLRGIAHTHKHGFIHTDLKLDNILFSCNMSTEDITSLLISDPSRRHDPEYSGDGIVQAAVSQPLPVPSFDDAMKRTFLIGDYSHAQPLSDRPPRSIAITPHRPPESIILGPWNEKADIWEFGCVAFELITARLPFDWESRPEYQLNEEANLLYQMMNTTQEAFSLDQLAKSDKRNDFFDKDASCSQCERQPRIKNQEINKP
ncbi:Dual specificity protein kinase lkh1 [Termitomyces sp. T112]|nr:Dual specificity protein kinase lkh1 [Termitomyces sp. T112]